MFLWPLHTHNILYTFLCMSDISNCLNHRTVKRWIFFAFSCTQNKNMRICSADNNKVEKYNKGETPSFLTSVSLSSDTGEKWASGCKRLQLWGKLMDDTPLLPPPPSTAPTNTTFFLIFIYFFLWVIWFSSCRRRRREGIQRQWER